MKKKATAEQAAAIVDALLVDLVERRGIGTRAEIRASWMALTIEVLDAPDLPSR